MAKTDNAPMPYISFLHLINAEHNFEGTTYVDWITTPGRKGDEDCTDLL